MKKELTYHLWWKEQERMLKATERAYKAGLKMTAYQANRRMSSDNLDYIYDTELLIPQMKFSGIVTRAFQIDDILKEWLELVEAGV